MSYFGAKLDYASSRVGMAIVGGLTASVGVGFLTVAAWTLLADVYGHIIASTSVGLVFLGAGLVIIARRPPPPQPTVPPSQALIAAFLTGLEGGRNARK